MKHEIQPFSNTDFGTINTITIDGEVWFVGNEIASLLGYENPRDALKKRVDSEDKNTVAIRDGIKRGNPNKTIINESGLYSLILSSKLPNAKKFKRWVTSEVIPAIRKHGAYMTPETIEEVLYNPDTIIRIATQLKEGQEKNKLLIATNQALTKEVNTWDNRAIINALVRAYAARVCPDNFRKAWNIFYKNLIYNLHINLRQRRATGKVVYSHLIDYVRDSEVMDVLQAAVAMCEQVGINTGEVINKTNEENIKSNNPSC